MGIGSYQEETAINLLEDVKPEETEYDVEEVLKKQNTHDLFCPICHSCISRRVILRKRRQNVRRFCNSAKKSAISPAPESISHQPAQPSNAASPMESEVPEVGYFDILKSIVYGGLIESIASLVVISSAAGGGATTLSTLALSLVNLISGLCILVHNLRELKNDLRGIQTRTVMGEDCYYQQLGRRENFCLHATVAVISFLIFGSVAPITYGFSFRKSDDREYKLAVVATASLLCIFLLALGKAHARRPPKSYIRTVLYYLMLGFASLVISFLVGDLVSKLLAELDLFESGSSSTSDTVVLRKMMSPPGLGWASY